MARFLLVHGSGHGAWCWRDVVPALAALGHVAEAIDLPAHGQDRTPPRDASLDAYRDALVARLDGPTVLVGHSMAGFPITAAAGAAPDRIAALVYLCAYVPVPGKSLADMRREGPRQPLLPAILRAGDGITFSFRDDMVNEVFYHDCPPEAQDFARAHLCPEPTRAQETPIADTAIAETLTRHYIRCTDDRAIPPEYQSTMSAGIPASNRHELASSHSPFLSRPDTLARLLATIAESRT